MATEKVEFNLNEFVWAKLTPHGLKVWQAHRDRYTHILPEYGHLPEPDGDGYHRFQLHQLMNIFGSQMIMGLPECIEMNVKFNASELYCEPLSN